MWLTHHGDEDTDDNAVANARITCSPGEMHPAIVASGKPPHVWRDFGEKQGLSNLARYFNLHGQGVAGAVVAIATR